MSALRLCCLGVLIAASVNGADLLCPTECHCFGDPTIYYTVNCTELGLTSVPDNLPSYATTLLLSRNAIKTISPPQLDGLTSLLQLDLSDNGLHTLASGSFDALSALEELVLKGNSLNFSSEVTASCFKPLVSLRLVDIRWNVEFGETYPQQLWRYLPNLESIQMDGIHGPLGDGFRNLTKLTTLSFQGARCNIDFVQSLSFADLKNSPLIKLDVERCGITFFNESAFQNLRSLTWLSVAFNPLSKNVLHMAAGLKYAPIRHLDLNETHIGDNAVELFQDKLCNIGLKWLSVANNTIYGFNRVMSRCFPDLEVFSFGNNCVFEYSDDVLDLLNMSSIVFMNMSYQYHYSNELTQNVPSRTVNGHICEQWEACPVSLPPHLEVIDLSYFGLHLPTIPSLIVMDVCHLKRLLVAHTGLTGFLGYMKCRYPDITVEELDLTGNRITTFSNEFFAYCDFSALKKLLLGGNVLASELDKQGDKPFFLYLTGLEVLDLSSNSLASLDRAVLQNKSNLTTVSLANNTFSDFDVDISHLKKLQHLDLSNNGIGYLSQETLYQLEQILPHSDVRINLQGNKLQCSCGCLDFYEWMSKNKAVFEDMNSYECTFTDGTTRVFDDFSVVLERLQGECSSKLWMTVPFIVNAIIMVITTTIALLYRWRFALEVMWYRPRSSIDEEDTVYAYDAFVGYNRHDLNWVQTELCRNLELDRSGHQAVNAGTPALASQDMNQIRLCCHHRDFLLGVHIFDNISEAFEKSRTTLMVVSNAALQGDWWQMELRLAVQTAAARRNNSLLFVFLEPLEGRLVTPQIRRILNSYTCERWWPGDRAKQQRLWQKLKLAMKFPSRNGLSQER